MVAWLLWAAVLCGFDEDEHPAKSKKGTNNSA
ncbi:hypothetical protein KOX_12075 [Klebsiella michiganensis KCTC 1686]|uniref:Uncharacterized protein n=1 Tax=Klebsiella michiganensis (strain ATCC 8724 / DSM 4798 / JCM 20051 / NBRC 3318 / NRRL B-199 / KCTC 1686 / BUCSAV 143 / CCM 1901) TaxID=1006551 RepID=A0A0H3H406_KLEM8|nr:hypothetical protein KOX_12075 [Klebsiella michiganensis KCTC 1686]